MEVRGWGMRVEHIRGTHCVGRKSGETTTGKLTTATVRNASRPGLHGDGANFYLAVAPGGSKSWIHASPSTAGAAISALAATHPSPSPRPDTSPWPTASPSPTASTRWPRSGKAAWRINAGRAGLHRPPHQARAAGSKVFTRKPRTGWLQLTDPSFVRLIRLQTRGGPYMTHQGSAASRCGAPLLRQRVLRREASPPMSPKPATKGARATEPTSDNPTCGPTPTRRSESSPAPLTVTGPHRCPPFMRTSTQPPTTRTCRALRECRERVLEAMQAVGDAQVSPGPIDSKQVKKRAQWTAVGLDEAKRPSVHGKAKKNR